MRAFAALFARLDATTSNQAKLAALDAWLRDASDADAAWAVYFLAGGKPRQLVPTRVLRQFALQASGLPEWLFDASYHAVGDLAETIALVTVAADEGRTPPAMDESDEGLATWIEDRLLPLRGLPPEVVVDRLALDWALLDANGRFVAAKLVTGAFRVGVSRSLVTRALAGIAEVDPKRISERLIGFTDKTNRPDAAQYARLVAPEDRDAVGQTLFEAPAGILPYPFFLAQSFAEPLDAMPTLLGAPTDWLIESKWDGIRAQVVHRGARVAVWSRGEELVTERFPELAAMVSGLPPGTVLDGEIVVWRDGRPQPFARLQRRLGRTAPGPKLLAEAPVCLLAYDLLEQSGEDWRGHDQRTRRDALERLVDAVHRARPDLASTLQLSPAVEAADWTTLDARRRTAHADGVEGLMLKAWDARYGVGRTRETGRWLKWKVDPYSVDAVLIYAQRGHGRRAGLYTDYTFGLWDHGPEGQGAAESRRLVPFAKAYSGLTDAEIREVDAIVRRTTTESYGPVRQVTPTLVFELGFEGIARSPRHRSGVAVRFPRMLRWRRDKPVTEADSLATLVALLPGP